MRSSFAILAMAVSAVSAQSVKTYKDSLDMTIDPNSVELTTRSSWCGAQQNTCDTLCSDNTDKNNCNDDTLNWECTCSSNSSAPGLQYYTQTMPTFICENLFAQCISQTNTQSGSEECKKKIQSKCAEQSPLRTLLATTTIPAPVPPTLLLLLPQPPRPHRTLVAPQRLCPRQVLMPLLPLPWRRRARVPLLPLLSACWPTSSKCFQG
ncbi:hypothetical protein NXS19_001454 [Fusarium pseudograminearum]|nr:hypothetical protein NXS19_001454 [Fusarium pseudograminearum]